MPRGDGRGPMGQGPQSGRGTGTCRGNNVEETGAGFGPGMGRPGGRGGQGGGGGRGRGGGRCRGGMGAGLAQNNATGQVPEVPMAPKEPASDAS